jgi:hypothetical protein
MLGHIRESHLRSSPLTSVENDSDDDVDAVLDEEGQPMKRNTTKFVGNYQKRNGVDGGHRPIDTRKEAFAHMLSRLRELDYGFKGALTKCLRSAQPVGELVLHYRVQWVQHSSFQHSYRRNSYLIHKETTRRT